ncbi:type II toxin-antitoxin system RelE/ParE family toxin [Amaricoccus macauensis]|uniref:type II toxin-antitoxin system RelE/ParE family toxin n=1 Tax=Amaricoccus macauensis TaxID=57001 RepID=UPI003C79D11E
MKSLVFSPGAAADIDGIWDYTVHRWDGDQAERYIDQIRDTCLALAAGRTTGRVVTVRSGYLKYPAGSHMIYYRETSARLEIIRILHQRMDVESHL